MRLFIRWMFSKMEYFCNSLACDICHQFTAFSFVENAITIIISTYFTICYLRFQENKKFVSIGLEGGYLKLSWTLLKPTREKKSKNSMPVNGKLSGWPHQTLSNTVVIKVLQAGKVSNGDWHTLELEILPGNITLLTDSKKVYEESGSKYEIKNSDVTLFIGKHFCNWLFYFHDLFLGYYIMLPFLHL